MIPRLIPAREHSVWTWRHPTGRSPGGRWGPATHEDAEGSDGSAGGTAACGASFSSSQRSVYDLVHKTGLWALSLLDSVLWRGGLGLVYPGLCYWFPNGFCLATSCCCSSSVETLGQWQWGFRRWLNHLNAPCLFPVAPSVPRFAACSLCAPLVVPVNACKVVIKDLVQYMVLWGGCFC